MGRSNPEDFVRLCITNEYLGLMVTLIDEDQDSHLGKESVCYKWLHLARARQF